MPPRPFLDVELDGILHSNLEEHQERAELATEVAAGFARELFALAQSDPPEEGEAQVATPDASPQEPRKRRKTTKKKGGQHRTMGGFPIKPDRTRTTEVILDGDSAEVVRRYEPEPVPQPPPGFPLLGSLLRLNELAPAELTHLLYGSLRLRATKSEGVTVLLCDRMVGVVNDEVAPEFIKQLRGRPPQLRRDAVMGLRYIDHESAVHLWLYLPAPTPGDPKWAELPLSERATSLLQCAFCGFPVGSAVSATLMTDYGVLRSGHGISLHERCVAGAEDQARAEGLSMQIRG